jgi:UDP-glucose 4-epimerase
VFDLPHADSAFVDNQENIQFIAGDLCQRSDLESACDGIDGAIHLAAVMPPLSETNRNLAIKVNVEGSRTLLSCLPADVSLVFASSVATYGQARTEIVKLDHPQQPIELYGTDKLQNERDIIASEHPCTMLRISGISVPALLEIPRPWFFTQEQKMEYVHLEDVATAVTACVGNEKTLGQTLQIAGGRDWRMTGEDYSRAMCEVFELPLRMVAYQDEVAWSGWYDTDLSEQLLKYQNHTFTDYIKQLMVLYQKAIGA